MMLSDKLSFAIKCAVGAMSTNEQAMDRLRRIGPRNIIAFVEGATRHEHVRNELAEKRDEAEQYVAGLLGMM